MNVEFFVSPAEFRQWLTEHGTTAKECWVGFWRKDSGRGGITYPEALDEALCLGWIDGIRKKVDEHSYTNRFTPRKARSHWSTVNIKRVQELIRLKRMTPAGIAAFERRNPARIGRGSYEQKTVILEPALARTFKAARSAWTFFQKQAPSYQRVALWWIVSAKRPETRSRRLSILIADSAAGRRLGLFTSKPKMK